MKAVPLAAAHLARHLRQVLALAAALALAMAGQRAAAQPSHEPAAPVAQHAAAPVPAARPSATLERIRKRGAIVVGVKNDYPPFGMLDAAGRIQGLEPDMAAELAARLGVRLELVAVSGANRLQKLQEGAVDVVIATTGDTAERRKLATLVEPNYYASGVTLMMRPDARLTRWQELRGQTVCAVQGSYFNRPMSQRYLLDLLTFGNGRDARLALRDGRCVGFLFDNTAIWADLRQAQWAGYQAPLPPAMVVPWSVALARTEAGGELEHWIGDVLAQWHRNGFLLDRERAWGLPPSAFLLDAQALWRARAAGGEPVCQRLPDGAWPPACRNRALLAAGDVAGLHHLGLELKHLTGWDFTVLYDGFDRRRFLGGLANTVLLMAACVAASLGLGVAGALLAESGWRLLGRMARALAVYGRMTPPLLQMYLLFFGLGSIAWTAWQWNLPAWAVAVAALGYYTGSSVMAALLEASALQRSRQPGFRLRARTVPQVYGDAAGSITASLVNVCKATMMASVIAVPELLSVATGIVADTGNTKEVMNLLLLCFLLLIAVAVRLLHRLERALRKLALAWQPANRRAPGGETA